MKIVRLPAGVGRIVHVVAANLRQNMDQGLNLPLVGIRLERQPDVPVLTCRHVDILGPSTLHHTPHDPLPGTDGRGVCVLRTRAELLCYLDEPEHIVVRSFGAPTRES